MATETTTAAILDARCETIEEVVEDVAGNLNDHPHAQRYGRRWVWLPGGGEVGDRVTVDDRGEATVDDAERDPRICVRCDAASEAWTCCGNPTDGSSGTGCTHDDGYPVCGPCWEAAENDGEVSSARAPTYRIETISGRGLPTEVDADGYDTREAAEAMADAEHDGEWRVVQEAR